MSAVWRLALHVDTIRSYKSEAAFCLRPLYSVQKELLVFDEAVKSEVLCLHHTWLAQCESRFARKVVTDGSEHASMYVGIPDTSVLVSQKLAAGLT